MTVHTLKAVQKIPATLKETWDFFSNPQNLNAITPDEMAFRILTKFKTEKIYRGQIIEYKVRPLLSIPVYWMTEITEFDEQKFFVDVQRKGPYSLWHHAHFFKAIDNGVEMTDIVNYKNPLGFVGELANSFLVKEQLKKIFNYRFLKIEEIFGKWEGQTCLIEFN